MSVALAPAPSNFLDRPAGMDDRVHVKPSVGFPMPRIGRVFGVDAFTGQLRVELDPSSGGHLIYCDSSSLVVLAGAR